MATRTAPLFAIGAPCIADAADGGDGSRNVETGIGLRMGDQSRSGKVFDQVNHDRMMGQIAKRIEDKRLLNLIRHS
jgi:hypothetical protein